MYLPRFLTTVLLVSAWAVPAVYADSGGPAAPAVSATPVPAAASAISTEAAAPAAATPVHDTVHTPPAEGSAERPAEANAATPEAKPETVAAEDDPIICRSQVETGTMGRRQKVCMTKSQWQAHTDSARRFKRSIDQSRSTQPGGGG